LKMCKRCAIRAEFEDSRSACAASSAKLAPHGIGGNQGHPSIFTRKIRFHYLGHVMIVPPRGNSQTLIKQIARASVAYRPAAVVSSTTYQHAACFKTVFVPLRGRACSTPTQCATMQLWGQRLLLHRQWQACHLQATLTIAASVENIFELPSADALPHTTIHQSQKRVLGGQKRLQIAISPNAGGFALHDT
jgi:hypothetical protein